MDHTIAIRKICPFLNLSHSGSLTTEHSNVRISQKTSTLQYSTNTSNLPATCSYNKMYVKTHPIASISLLFRLTQSFIPMKKISRILLTIKSKN